jgi:GNAT superfamily N-acetyltransferase
MMTATGYCLIPINPFTAARFASLTFRGYRAAMESCGTGSGLCAVGASVDDTPVGLALGRALSATHARVLSLYVVPAFRNRGIGTSLLGQLEAQLSKQGCEGAELSYALGTYGTSRLERVLQKCGWPAAGDRLHAFCLDGQILSAPWFGTTVLPSPYGIAPWSTITEDERQRLLRSQETERWIPENLIPFRYEADLEPLNSLLLRHGDSVIGWALTQRFDESTLSYANLYVRPSLNRAGRTFASLALLAESVRRQTSALGVASRGTFEVVPENTPFLRFIDRHFGPYLLSRGLLQRLTRALPGRHSASGLKRQ